MYNIIPTTQFQKDIKYYKFKEKYTKIDDDVDFSSFRIRKRERPRKYHK